MIRASWVAFLVIPVLLSGTAWARPWGKKFPIDGVWKLESEYPGRQIYYFKVKGGESHLVYPPDKAFEGQVPHAGNTFKLTGKDEFVLSAMVKTTDGPTNLFTMLAEQHKNDPAKAAAFKTLSETGLKYKLNSAGELVPQVPDEIKVWLPKLVPSSGKEADAAAKLGQAFEKSMFEEQQISFPQSEPVTPCPDGLKPLVPFSKEAFEELKKIVRFKPSRTADANVLEGKTEYNLFIQQSPSERALGLFFYEADVPKWGPMKMYNVSGNQWVVPNGDVDAVTKAPLCQRVLLQLALPVVRNGKQPAPATGAQPK